jgi:hypothetical protein
MRRGGSDLLPNEILMIKSEVRVAPLNKLVAGMAIRILDGREKH